MTVTKRKERTDGVNKVSRRPLKAEGGGPISALMFLRTVKWRHHHLMSHDPVCVRRGSLCGRWTIPYDE